MVFMKYILVVVAGCFIGTQAKPSASEDTPKTMLNQGSIDWLQRFGYFVRPDPRVGTLISEKTLSKSIVQLQRFAGLKVTGVLDDETKKLVGKSRCGMPDFGPTDLTKRRKRRYALQGSKWTKKELTWKLENDNNDGLSKGTVISVLRRAFDKWARETQLTFTQVTGNVYADILVSFETRYHNDAYPFDGSGGTLAHAFYPHNNKGLSGDVHFDDDEHFTHETDRGKNLYFVAVHEIGHSLGLEHSNRREAIMFPWYPGYRGAEFDLSQDDVVGIRALYGNPLKPSQTTSTSVSTKEQPTPETRLCVDQIKAVFLDKSNRIFIINKDKLYILKKPLALEKGPIDVGQYFQGVLTVDAAYRREDGNTVIFSGQQFHVFDGTRKISGPTRISDYYKGIPSTITKIDAAFIWTGNRKTYLFKGKQYWRFDSSRQSVDPGYPRNIVPNWNGIPPNIDAVFTWANGRTYFFKGTQYYRINDRPLRLDPGYPKSILSVWMRCSSALQAGGGNGGNALQGSLKHSHLTVLTAMVMFSVAKIFY